MISILKNNGGDFTSYLEEKKQTQESNGRTPFNG
jgi:hypothetical protein